MMFFSAPRWLVFVLPLIALGAVTTQAAPIEKRNWDFVAAGEIPVQTGGRVKPLDSYARELVLSITGSRRFEGWKPVEMIFSWLTATEHWENTAFIQVGNKDVKAQLGLDLKRTRFSPKELIETSYLSQYAARLTGPDANSLANPPLAGGALKVDSRQKELNQVMERLTLYRAMATGEGWPIVPTQDASKPWDSLWMAFHLKNDKFPQAALAQLKPIHKGVWAAYLGMIQSYVEGNEEAFHARSVSALAYVKTQIKGWDASLDRTNLLELWYNRTRPFLYSWILCLVGGLTLLVGQMSTRKQKTFDLIGRTLIIGGLLAQIVGMAVRSWVAGRPPVTNMYETIIWVAFGTLLFALILYALQKKRVLLVVGAIVSALFLIVADAAPTVMDPGIHPLVPVLRSNYWLTIHVLTITLAYAAFALALGIGNVTLAYFLKKDQTGVAAKVHGLNHLTYRCLQFGVVLLAAGTILGGIWADYSWGRFWGWDPKEVWALIALLGYIAILHARYTGWMGQFGFPAWTIASFLLVIMAWYGVNFVLGVGLHSYGFSASAGQFWVALFCLIQLAYVGLVAVKRKR